VGLFNKLIRNQNKQDFSSWLDRHLSKDLSASILAFCFNIYEGSSHTYEIELVGCASFDDYDDDWACDEIFATRDDLFSISRTRDIAHWEQGLSIVIAHVKQYLADGKYADKLKNARAVGVGFVDGNIEIIQKGVAS